MNFAEIFKLSSTVKLYFIRIQIHFGNYFEITLLILYIYLFYTYNFDKDEIIIFFIFFFFKFRVGLHSNVQKILTVYFE